MKITVTRIHIILLFVFLFISIGWMAPVMYTANAPQSQFIEENNFDAEDGYAGQDSHTLCFNRTVHRSNTAEVFTNLYLVDDGDKELREVAVTSEHRELFLREGEKTVYLSNELPERLEAGEYRYMLVINMKLSNGRVERTFTFQSDKFTISAEKPTDYSNKRLC